MIIYPDVRHNKLMKKIVRSVNNYVENGKVIYNYEMLKELPKKVCFDWDIHLSEHPQMTEEEIKLTQEIVLKAMASVHSSDYFSIAKSEIPFSKRLYVRKYLKIDDEKGNEFLENLNEGNKILIVDDINTTGATLHEMLRNIYKINNECEIYIFTLIGKQRGSMIKKKDRYDSFNVRFKLDIKSYDINNIIFEYVILDTNNIDEKTNTYNVYKGRLVKNNTKSDAKGMLLTEHDVCPVRDNDCGLYFDDIGDHKYEKEKNVYLLDDKEYYYYFFKILSIAKEIQKREEDDNGEIIDLILNMDNYVKSNCNKVDDKLKNSIFEYAHFYIHIWG